MKKKILLLILVLFAFLPINVLASGSFSAPSTLKVTTGKTASFTLSANYCAGKFDISSSNTSVAGVNTSSIWLDDNSTTIVVTGYKAGTAKITITPTDVTDYDENTVSGSKTITVTVSNPTTKTTTKKPTTTERTTTKSLTTAPTTKKSTTHATTSARTIIVDTTNATNTTTTTYTTATTPRITYSTVTTSITEGAQTSIRRENGTTQVVYKDTPQDDTSRRSGIVYENGTTKIVYYDGYNSNENYYYTTKPVIVNGTTKPALLIDEVIIDGFKVTYKNGVFYAKVNQDTEKVNIKTKHRDYLTVDGEGERNLSYGINNVELKITDKAGNTQSVYVIITRPNGDDYLVARLAQLSLVGYEFDFKSDQFEYTVKVPSKTNDVYVVAVASDPDADVSGDGLNTLKGDKTDVIVTVSSGEYGSNTYIIHVEKESNFLLYALIIGGFTISMIAIGGYIIAKRKNWIAKTEEEKENILSNESKQVSVDGAIEINGEERKIGERIVKPTLVNAVQTEVAQPVKVVTTAPKVEAARPVQTVVVHPDVAPKIVKTAAPANPQVKVVPTHTEEKQVIEKQITTTINFDEN